MVALFDERRSMPSSDEISAVIIALARKSSVAYAQRHMRSVSINIIVSSSGGIIARVSASRHHHQASKARKNDIKYHRLLSLLLYQYRIINVA